MEYINEGSTLPPPLNILPTPKGVYELFQKIITEVKKKPNNNKNIGRNQLVPQALTNHFRVSSIIV